MAKLADNYEWLPGKLVEVEQPSFHYPAGSEQMTEELSYPDRSSGRDSNHAPSEYKHTTTPDTYIFY
jgi:hypothetical protein